MNEESTLLSFGGVCKAGDCLREVNIISFPLLFTCSLGNSGGGGGRITGEFENSALGATDGNDSTLPGHHSAEGSAAPSYAVMEKKRKGGRWREERALELELSENFIYKNKTPENRL